MPRLPSAGDSRRYRRVAVTYTVAREHAPASWPTLSSPEAAPTSPANCWRSTMMTASTSG